LDYINDMSIPRGNWGQANYFEPIVRDFPQYGSGGATQAIVNNNINITNIWGLN